MSISRSRPILKRPGKQLPNDLDTETSPNALPDPTSVAPEDEGQDSVSQPGLPEEDDAEQVEDTISPDKPDLGADSPVEPSVSRSGKALDWSGFPIDMGSAIS